MFGLKCVWSTSAENETQNLKEQVFWLLALDSYADS